MPGRRLPPRARHHRSTARSAPRGGKRTLRTSGGSAPPPRSPQPSRSETARTPHAFETRHGPTGARLRHLLALRDDHGDSLASVLEIRHRAPLCTLTAAAPINQPWSWLRGRVERAHVAHPERPLAIAGATADVTGQEPPQGRVVAATWRSSVPRSCRRASALIGNPGGAGDSGPPAISVLGRGPGCAPTGTRRNTPRRS